MKELNELSLKEYDALLDAGLLFEFFPEATGKAMFDLQIVIPVEEDNQEGC